jgi:hypothetical protein
VSDVGSLESPWFLLQPPLLDALHGTTLAQGSDIAGPVRVAIPALFSQFECATGGAGYHDGENSSHAPPPNVVT